MDVIKRKVNGRECEAIISDSVVEGLHQLQNDDLCDGYNHLMVRIIRFLTDDYEKSNAQEILTCIADLSVYSDIIRLLTDTKE